MGSSWGCYFGSLFRSRSHIWGGIRGHNRLIIVNNFRVFCIYGVDLGSQHISGILVFPVARSSLRDTHRLMHFAILDKLFDGIRILYKFITDPNFVNQNSISILILSASPTPP